MGENLPVIRISVRNLVEFILREGDIDNRTGGRQDPENMQMGSRIHRKDRIIRQRCHLRQRLPVTDLF